MFGNNDFVLEKENTEQFTVSIYERKHYFPENINLNERKKKKNLFLNPYLGKEEQTAENYFPNIL